MITMNDIAEKAGVSSTTVSRVLNKKSSSIPISVSTKEKVLKIAKEFGYRPNMFAKSLRTKKSFLIGVVLWDLTDPFFSDILRGIENVLDKSEYNLIFASADADNDRQQKGIEKMHNLRTDGMLIVGGGSRLTKKGLQSMGIDTSSVVLVGAKSFYNGINSVIIDNKKGGFIGIEYLAQKKPASLFYIAGEDKTADMEERLQGVKDAAVHYSIAEILNVFEAGPGEEEGYEVTQKILLQKRFPIAIFAVNDLTAIGVVRAVKDHNFNIPDDVMIIGFDDISMSNYLEPRLSTIRQPRLQMGRDGAKLLLELIDKKKDEQTDNIFTKVLKPELVVREST